MSTGSDYIIHEGLDGKVHHVKFLGRSGSNAQIQFDDGSIKDVPTSTIFRDFNSFDEHRQVRQAGIGGLKGSQLAADLKRLGIHVLDVETTGLRDRDVMFSAGVTQIDIGTGDSISNGREYHFRGGIKGLKTGNTTDIIEHNENVLEKKHSSNIFGAKQRKAGSLRLAAQGFAAYGGNVLPETNPLDPATYRQANPSDFIRELNRDLQSNANGNVIFTHNSSFEDRQFNKLYGSSRGGKTYNQEFSSLLSRNIGNKGFVGHSDELSFSRRGAATKSLASEGSEALRALESVRKTGDPVQIREALMHYASTQKAIINHIADNVHNVVGKQGAFTGIDSMHMFRALMSFAALNGDVDVKNLRLGNSVDTQMKTWFGDQLNESHQALDDARWQGRIAAVLVDELEQYSKDPTRRSKRMQAINKFINENDIAVKTFKRNLETEIFDIEKTAKDRTTGNVYYGKGHVSNHVRSVISYFSKKEEELLDLPDDTTRQRKYLHALKSTVLDTYNNGKFSSVQTFIDEIGNIITADDFEDVVNGTQLPKRVKKNPAFIDKFTENVKQHKGFYLAAASLIGANLVLGGKKDKQQVEYNTYDELYNGQYYGTGFADWQNANNAHKILY